MIKLTLIGALTWEKWRLRLNPAVLFCVNIYQLRSLVVQVVISACSRYCRLSKARLVSNKAICAAVKTSLSTAECLSKRYSISMRHYIIQNGIYCARIGTRRRRRRKAMKSMPVKNIVGIIKYKRKAVQTLGKSQLGSCFPLPNSSFSNCK